MPCPCIQVQCTGVGDGGQRVPGRLAVIDAVHGKAGGHKTLGSGVQTGRGHIHILPGDAGKRLPQFLIGKHRIFGAVEQQCQVVSE